MNKIVGGSRFLPSTNLPIAAVIHQSGAFQAVASIFPPHDHCSAAAITILSARVANKGGPRPTAPLIVHIDYQYIP
jgi:hypothetical protein